MLERDFEPFCSMLQDVWGFYPTAKQPSTGQMAMFFRAVGDHSIAQVRSGFDGHMRDPQRGRFAPLPSDVIAQIEGQAAKDMRPGPEEAWAIALTAADEAGTVVWTEEIAQAWGVARTVYAQGDDVGARMAFREAYNRLVAQARSHGVKAMWSASIGVDPERRDAALHRAHVAGLLVAPEVLHALPSPDHALSPTNTSMPPEVRERLMTLRARLVTPKEAPVCESQAMGTFRPIPPDALPVGMPGSTRRDAEA